MIRLTTARVVLQWDSDAGSAVDRGAAGLAYCGNWMAPPEMMGRVRAGLSVLRLRDFRYLYLASSISFIGNVFTTVALALGVLAATGSVTAIGVVVAARQVTQVVFLLVGGAWGDRVQRTRLIGTCYVGSALTQAGLAALLITGGGATWSLALVAAANGALAAFLAPAWQGAIPDTVPKPQLQQANALFSITRSSANIAGAVLAGLLVAAVNPGWALVIDAASFVVGAVLVLQIPSAPLELTRSPLLTDLRVGWREFTARTWVWVVVAQFSVYNVAYAAGFGIYAPVIAKRDLGGAHAYGLIVAALGLGSVVGALSLLRFTPRRPLLVGVAAILTSIPVMAFLAAGLPLTSVVIAAAVSGASLELFDVLWESALQTHIPQDRLSRVSSYDSLGSFVFTPLGSALAGPLAIAVGSVHSATWLMVGLMTAPTLAVLLVPDVWRLQRIDTAPST